MPGAGGAFSIVFGLVLCGLAAGLPLLMILNAWLVDKTLGPVEGILCVAGVFLVLGLVAVTRGTIWSVILLGVLIGGCALLPALSRWSNRRGLAALDQEDIEKYERTLAFDPKNAAAHSFLGQIYLRQGRYEEAIHHLERAVELDPKSSKDRWHLEKAVQAQAEKDEAFVVCRECSTRNPAGATACAHCEAPLRHPNFLQWLVRPKNAKQVGKIGLGVYGGLLVLGLVFQILPAPFNAVFTLIVLVVGGFMAYRYLAA